ncbi:MAG: hypothetical protein PHQ18_03055 [Patescibacteria group bacterium]|nr:hypothetical protein [Patescibacteria group bacterium]
MKKQIITILAVTLFLTGCTQNIDANKKIEPVVYNEIDTTLTEPGIYHEIETTLTSEIVDDMVNFSVLVPKEITKLQKTGQNFWFDQNQKINMKEPMYHLYEKVECKDNSKSDCSIVGLKAYKNNLPPDFKIGECDSDDWCLITEPAFQKDLTNNIKQLSGFYGFGKDIYTIGSNEGSLNGEGINGEYNYSIYKNDKEIFSHPMYFGAESIIEDASIVSDSPAFTFYDPINITNENNPITTNNIWYNDETINKKYEVDSSSYLFSYQNKTGFVGEKDGKKFVFFNGQKISENFDEIRTTSCCAVFSYPIELDKSGIMFFLAKRGEKYFFVEINLNEYLK